MSWLHGAVQCRAARIGTHFPHVLAGEYSLLYLSRLTSPSLPSEVTKLYVERMCSLDKDRTELCPPPRRTARGKAGVPRAGLLYPLGSCSCVLCSLKPIRTRRGIFERRSLSHNEADEASSILDSAF